MHWFCQLDPEQLEVARRAYSLVIDELSVSHQMTINEALRRKVADVILDEIQLHAIDPELLRDHCVKVVLRNDVRVSVWQPMTKSAFR